MAFFPPIRVIFNEDESTAQVFKPWPLDVAKLEREMGGDSRSSIEAPLKLAWFASQRGGNTREYEEWASTISDFTPLGEDGEPLGEDEDPTPDPTKAAPQPG